MEYSNNPIAIKLPYFVSIIDEAGPGGIWGVIGNTDLNYNFDEGLHFDTEGDGNFVDFKFANIFGVDEAGDGE